MVYRAGLDWSGDPGDPSRPGSSSTLVFAIVHILENELDKLGDAMARVRRRRGLPPTYAFKFKNARDEIRAAFFAEVCECPITVHILVVDKVQWPRSYVRASGGPDRINQGIVDLVQGCADRFSGGQALLIDGKRHDSTTLRLTRQALSQAIGHSGDEVLRKVRICEDDREAVIQAADMFAGLLRTEGPGSRHLVRFGNKVRLV